MNSAVCSLTLNVRDIVKTRDYYEKRGFRVFLGDITQYWLFMKKGDYIIGLFQRVLDSSFPFSLYA